MVLCKPKLLPLKSFTLQKLEKMQKEASAKAKGQIMSECIYEIIDFPKYHQKNLMKISALEGFID